MLFIRRFTKAKTKRHQSWPPVYVWPRAFLETLWWDKPSYRMRTVNQGA